MPYWERHHALARMFESFERVYRSPTTTGGHGLEFSICDDGSPTEPAQVPRSAAAWSEVVLTRLPEKRGPLNPCVPINTAVRASQHDIIVLTNPEIEHREPTLQRMLELLQGPDDYVVASCFDEKRGWLAGDQVNYRTGGRLPVPPGAHFHFCAMLHRSLWDRAGGFDESYRHHQAGEDNDWLFRLQRAGARFRTCPSVVHHLHLSAPVRWGLPHGRELFFEKWPEAAGA